MKSNTVLQRLGIATYRISKQRFDSLARSSRKSSIEDLHDEIFQIYIEIKKICDKHKLAYFAEGGTWVGAALLHDFVPWDDDMDLRMPRADYEKFKKIAKRELPEHLELLDCVSDPCSSGNMLKVHNTRTAFIEGHKALTPNQWTGIFIDITPFDLAPELHAERENLRIEGTKLFIKNILRKRNHIQLDLKNYRHTWWYSLYADNNLKPPRNAMSAALRYAGLFFRPANYYAAKLDGLWRPYNDRKQHAWITCPERPWEKRGRILYLQKKWYDRSEVVRFRTSTMPLPIGYKEISTLSYGYPPAIDDNHKVSKHLDGAILDTSKSYLDYIKDLN